MFDSFAIAALAALATLLLVAWRVRKHGLPTFASKPIKARGLSSIAARAAARQSAAGQIPTIKPKRFGKR